MPGLTKLCVDKGRENKANLNCSENDQQWRGGWGACGNMVGIERRIE